MNTFSNNHCNQSEELNSIDFYSTQIWVNAETGEAFLEAETLLNPQYLGVVSDLENYAEREPAICCVPDETGGSVRVACYIWKNTELGEPITEEDFDTSGDFLKYVGIL